MRLREKQKVATRQAILDAAEKRLTATGLETVRMDDLAKDVGVSVGTLYNFFKDREQLLAELLQRFRSTLVPKLQEGLASIAGHDVERGLCRFIQIGYGHLLENWGLLRVLTMSEQGKGNSAPCPEQAHSMHGILWGAHEEAISRAMKAGAIRRGDVTLMTAMLVGTIRTIIFHDLWSNKPQPADKRAKCIVDLFLHGAGAAIAPLKKRGAKKRVKSNPLKTKSRSKQ